MNVTRSQKLFAELLQIIKTLRGPEGCPWDRKQTHLSLVPFMLEEAHEAVAAIEDAQMNELAAELGDVMLQIVLHSEIASERLLEGTEDGFDISTVLQKICQKLIHRHPHVFGNVQVKTAEDVLQNWQIIKVAERKSLSDDSILNSVSASLPQLLVAHKYQERAALTGFDWDSIDDVFEKVHEELHELTVEIDNQALHENVEAELGDLLFAIVNLSRFLKINSDEALRKANAKFKRRFSAVEKALGGIEKMKKMSLEELDLEWDRVKSDEKQSNSTPNR